MDPAWARRLEPSAAVIHVAGEIDLSNAPELQTLLLDAIGEDPRIVVDLTDVSFLDACGLGVLVSAKRRAERAGGLMYLTCVHGACKRVIEVCKLDEWFQIYPSVAAALDECARAEPQALPG